ncbi:MAG: hypothetical protein C5B45_04100 [Chlamydiae bacterium]|nr:MAG: hypothetical protein C5B45_04100 [Chlamydiota bacterium]
MFIKLSECYYTNKFIPVSTDSTVLKIVKVSGLIFLGPIVFFFDYGLKLLAGRNIRQQKDSDLSSLIENTLASTETLTVLPVVDQVSTEMHADKLSVTIQKNALGTELSSLKETIESRLGSAETLDVLPVVVEQVSTEMPADKVSLAVQKKTLETCLKGFRTDPKNFSIPIHQHSSEVIERLCKKYSNDELSNDYKEHTCILRDAMSTKEYKNTEHQETASIIQELCFAKFVYTILTDLEEGILKNTIGFDSPRNMTSSNISKWIKEDNKILSKQHKTVWQSIVLNYEKGCNAAGINSDQLCSANIPELRSIHRVEQGSEPYNVYYIRYPTPTIETRQSLWARCKGANATAIALEFIGFLDRIQRKKIPFLHVNHQYMDKKNHDFLLSADNNRAEAIQRLEETYGVFHFLSLPFDGPVIDEIDKEDFIKWKQNLVSNVIGEKEGFKLPKKFRKSAASKQQEIGQLLDKLHNLYFSEKPELNRAERRVLLVIFYSYLKEYFKSGYQIRIMASVCKDNKDRGNVSACIDEALFNLRLGKENNQRALKDLHLRILSPFIFRNERIVEHRLAFLTNLLDHIATLDEAQKRKIHAFKVNEQYQIIDQWIPRFNEDITI